MYLVNIICSHVTGVFIEAATPAEALDKAKEVNVADLRLDWDPIGEAAYHVYDDRGDLLLSAEPIEAPSFGNGYGPVP